MAVDHLGNIVWICSVLPGTSADVKIWDTVITGAVRALCENAPYSPCWYTRGFCFSLMLATGNRVLNFAPPMLLGMDHACFCRGVVFRGVPGINNVIIGAMPALCENAPIEPVEPVEPEGKKNDLATPDECNSSTQNGEPRIYDGECSRWCSLLSGCEMHGPHKHTHPVEAWHCQILEALDLT